MPRSWGHQISAECFPHKTQTAGLERIYTSKHERRKTSDLSGVSGRGTDKLHLFGVLEQIPFRQFDTFNSTSPQTNIIFSQVLPLYKLIQLGKKSYPSDFSLSDTSFSKLIQTFV